MSKACNRSHNQSKKIHPSHTNSVICSQIPMIQYPSTHNTSLLSWDDQYLTTIQPIRAQCSVMWLLFNQWELSIQPCDNYSTNENKHSVNEWCLMLWVKIISNGRIIVTRVTDFNLILIVLIKIIRTKQSKPSETNLELFNNNFEISSASNRSKFLSDSLQWLDVCQVAAH